MDRIIRQVRPGWIQSFGSDLLRRYERFGPLEKIQVPISRRLSVVAPHPDDESIGCGGLIALWSKNDEPVDVVFLTKGELGSVAARDINASPEDREISRKAISGIRKTEAEVALRKLGGTGTWLDGSDGSLFADQDRLVRQLSDHWQETRPDVIAAPFPADRHQDHAAAAAIVAQAATAVLDRKTMVLGYEVWSAAPVNAVLDITSVADKKWDAIAQHKSQTATTDYVAGAQALATYRAVSSGQTSGFAEAFFQQNVVDYSELAARLKV